jgi:hypothetical protein
MGVISNHETELKVVISKHNTGSVKYSYLSNKIQNLLVGTYVRAETISEIKKAKYFFIVI